MNRRWYIIALVVLAALTGCRKEAVPDDVPVLPEETPEMVISVRSETPQPKFTFLFWHKEDFDKGLMNAAPYYVASPDGNINDYEEPVVFTDNKNDYNTGKSYPENYGIAVCTGYAPYDGLTPDENYQTLTVAQPGVTDVLVARNVLEGSAIFPFSGNLEFIHSQIQLTVYATLASTMTKYIKDVSFTVDKENLLSSLVWNADVNGYRPSEVRPSTNWTSQTLDGQVNKSDKKQLGMVYVVPLPSSDDWKMKSIDLTISGKIGNTTDGSYSPFTMTVPAAFIDDSDNELTLGLNDSYKIYLIFDEDQIEITAVKVPWEEGGNVLVPIHPIPPETL